MREIKYRAFGNRGRQKEFEYRTNCQNLVSAGRVEADNMPDRIAKLLKRFGVCVDLEQR